jgi:endonuclease/exonuclease/phosphatase family metal-dependent hydrolase
MSPTSGKPVVVATHNLMHGLRLGALIPHYVALRDEQGLDLLCLQENRFPDADKGLPSDQIAAALGPAYQVVRDDESPGLAFVYDARTLACEARAIVPLPRLRSLNPFERLYIVGGKTRQKHLLLAEMRALDSHSLFAAACFHLDTAGGNKHRATQVEAIAATLRERNLHHEFVACGDSNAFAWRRQPAALQRLLAPLASLGATDPGTRPTHYFARQNEGTIVHRTGVLLGKLGIDIPLRYDVICTNLPTPERGQVVTPDSDHDLVWARVDLGTGRPLTPGLGGD